MPKLTHNDKSMAWLQRHEAGHKVASYGCGTCDFDHSRCLLAVVFWFTGGMMFVSSALTIDFAAGLRAGLRRLTSAKAMRSTNGGPCRPRLCGDSMGPF